MTLEELEARVRYLEDYNAICKLQSTYSHYHHCCMWEKIPSLFAQKTPGIEIEISDKGVFEGFDAPKRVFSNTEDNKTVPVTQGWLGLHMSVNPVIEINKSGTQAKGMWHAPGCITSVVNGELIAEWFYGKYIMEYVKEDEEWKILKFKYRLTFDTPFDKGWVEAPTVKRTRVTTKSLPPDRPTTYYKPYSPDGIFVSEPPPEPYNE
jgi:hypothetical protein